MQTALATAVPLVDTINQYDDVDVEAIDATGRYRKDFGDIAGLANSILEIGILQPIVITNEGKLVDGGRRLAAFRSLGWSRIPARRVNIKSIVRGEHDANSYSKPWTPSEQVAIAEAMRAEMGNRQGQRTELLQNLAEVAGRTTREIVAAKAGFGNPETYRQAKTVVTKGVPELVEAMDRGDVSISAAATIAKQPADVQRLHITANDNKPTTRLASYSGDNEWYTPARYVEMARDVMGEIDVDPASNDHAQKTVRAASYYTAETNGLDKEWHGKVWMNPPYSNPEIQNFVAKLIEEFKSGRCTEAIVLTNNAGDTAWSHALKAAASRWCVTRGRIRFESLTRESGAGAMGQIFYYFGDDCDRFRDVFGEIGSVERRDD
jgi:phage N-6-adenine-methyltransferase